MYGYAVAAVATIVVAVLWFQRETRNAEVRELRRWLDNAVRVAAEEGASLVEARNELAVAEAAVAALRWEQDVVVEEAHARFEENARLETRLVVANEFIEHLEHELDGYEAQVHRLTVEMDKVAEQRDNAFRARDKWRDSARSAAKTAEVRVAEVEAELDAALDVADELCAHLKKSWDQPVAAPSPAPAGEANPWLITETDARTYLSKMLDPRGGVWLHGLLCTDVACTTCFPPN